LRALLGMILGCQTCVRAFPKKCIKTYTLEQMCQHVSSCHNVRVQADAGTHTGYAYCNSCPRRNGHGRRLPSFRDVQNHLLDHNIDVREYDDIELVQSDGMETFY
jgi:hypothetical protein